MSFDPSLTGSSEAGLFGLPFSCDESQVLIIPVAWDVTTSYGGGTSLGPQSVLKASPQIDLFDVGFEKQYQKGFHLLQELDSLLTLNNELRPLALQIRKELEETGALTEKAKATLDRVNKACSEMVQGVETTAKTWLAKNKIVGVLGGDHSSPEGLIKALSESRDGDFSILHIDAHADLRNAYQGFDHSHASIMFNVMNAAWKPQKLVQVGLRDLCEEEYDLTKDRSDIVAFFDRNLKSKKYSGQTWSQQCSEIIQHLGKHVYISFDIDGLDPAFCPSTGTPVPGGLQFDEAIYLIESIARSGRSIIGFDLCEVAPHPELESNEWDGNVGARVLYQLCGWSSWSSQRA